MQASERRRGYCLYRCYRNRFVNGACIYVEQILIGSGYALLFLFGLCRNCFRDRIPAGDLFSRKVRGGQYRCRCFGCRRSITCISSSRRRGGGRSRVRRGYSAWIFLNIIYILLHQFRQYCLTQIVTHTYSF